MDYLKRKFVIVSHFFWSITTILVLSESIRKQTTTITTLKKIPGIRGVWGDPDVHDLTPTRTRYVKRSAPTDPQKMFLKKINDFRNIL